MANMGLTEPIIRSRRFGHPVGRQMATASRWFPEVSSVYRGHRHPAGKRELEEVFRYERTGLDESRSHGAIRGHRYGAPQFLSRLQARDRMPEEMFTSTLNHLQ